jgi:hypothetical protein
MTANKAIEILDREYDDFIRYKDLLWRLNGDEVTDYLIALLTAIDALKEKCDTIK